jgi:hypothetical protein
MKKNDFDFIKSFDEIEGPDIFYLTIDDISYFGYIDKSPASQRLVDAFQYKDTYSNFDKPYRAHWLISDSKLLLGYVNGVINGRKLNTDDIFPEYANVDKGLLFFDSFSGILLFYPIEFDTKLIDRVKYKGNNIILHIENGLLIKTEYEGVF